MSKKFFGRLRRELNLRKLVPHQECRERIIRARVPLDDIARDDATGISVINSLGIPLDGKANSCLIDAYAVLKSLQAKTDFKISNLSGRPLITVNGITVEVESAQDIFILREVFVDTTYCIRCALPTTVIDIGANIGTSVLYFASLPHVIDVLGFEPVTPTFQRASANIERNSHLAPKIKIHNFGLGDREDSFEIPFSLEKKGNVSLTHNTQRLGENVVAEPVKLKDAARILEPILNGQSDRFVVVKVDCEGGEYPILSALAEKNLLRLVDCFMIEFHYDGPHALTSQLTENGFSVITIEENSRIGILYASKVPPR
ncbi:MAG: FkbM family methyltransferase [Planctomycetaceae bacterium]